MERGLPQVIQADNGPELRGRVLDQWAYEHGVKLQFIAPGKSIQNNYVEVSMRGCEKSASTSTSSFLSTTPAARSNAGASPTIANVPIRASATLTRKSSQQRTK